MAKAAAIPVNRIFRAFSDATRLRILSLLKAGELCVGDLVAVLGVPQPKVSRHLAYLRRAGLVEARGQGLWNFYRLAAPTTAFHGKLIECLSACFGDVPKVARDAEKAKALKKSGGCCRDSANRPPYV